MDAFDLSNVKTEKRSKAMQRRKITKTLRILELCVALLFLSWFLTRLPFALRLSAEYLRSPLFVFAVSNAIIAALIAQSRQLAQSESTSRVAEHHQISDTCTDTDSGKYCRGSQSEKLKEKGENGNETVRREKSYPQDKLSNEEFRRTIEAFISKQMRLLREESFPIFVRTSEPTNTRATPKSLSNY